MVQSDSTSTVLYAFELLIGPSTRPECVKYRTPLFTVDGGIGTWSWPEKVASTTPDDSRISLTTAAFLSVQSSTHALFLALPHGVSGPQSTGPPGPPSS